MPSARPRPRRSPALLVALATVMSLLLPSCSGDDEQEAAKKAAEREQVTRSPLTGLPVKGKVQTRPGRAVTVDTSDNSARQVGLGSADLVAEELVEGGSTRLAAFYYTDVPGVV